MPNLARSKAYLAFDFGAESGRAVLGHLQAGILTTKEVHRFPNEPVEYGGSLHWDVPRLWLEVRKALTEVEGTELAGIGVDAWGVDYALIGERGELLQNPYHYRDRRTEDIMAEVFQRVSKEEIYAATGIQFMPINTIYQLFAALRETPSILAAAKQLVTIPDLFHYWLTGNAVCEFTNATTTQLVDPFRRTWASELMQKVGLRPELPASIVEPGTLIGTLRPFLAQNSSWSSTPVIAPACHDTGSAVAAAVVVSNHGGRQLDSVSATIRALPEVISAVNGRTEVLMDGGIRRGSDIVKAICLGARAVLVGRAYAYGLAAKGYSGVVCALEILRSDVERTLRLLGCPSVSALASSFVEKSSGRR
jgi:sugar (pentulose or hexulose) kinase